MLKNIRTKEATEKDASLEMLFSVDKLRNQSYFWVPGQNLLNLMECAIDFAPGKMGKGTSPQIPNPSQSASILEHVTQSLAS